jgi:hypothetical protein
MWRDRGGDAVLVIEAKRPGCGRKGCGEKDDPTSRYYLHYAAMNGIARRSQALLIDERDIHNLPDHLRNGPSLITWQDLIRIQVDEVNALQIDREVKELVLQRLTAHHVDLGLIAPNALPPIARADAARYAVLRAMDAPDCIKDWLIGSELYFAARNGSDVVQPPYDWLAMEPTISDYALGRRQSTSDREAPIWHLNIVR